jgi:glycosyltransferase involved in cell wall biosynthesis
MRIALVLLNRNEIEALPQILPKIPVDAVERVLCVDGGSTDGSAEMLVQWGFEVVPQAAMGRGEAFRLAFEILTDDVDAVIFF